MDEHAEGDDRRMGRIAAQLVVVGVLLSFPAAASLSVEEGADLVRALAGPGEVVGEGVADAISDRVTVGHYPSKRADGSQVKHRVNLTEGRYSGFTQQTPPSRLARKRLTEPEALELAKSTARAFLGADAEGLVWTPQGAVVEGHYAFEAGPDEAEDGIPSRTGAMCWVTVDPSVGAVWSYSQVPGMAIDNPEEVMDRERASELALAAYGEAAEVRVAKTRLGAYHGAPTWEILVQSADRGECYYGIDAITGDVAYTFRAGGYGTPQAASSSSAAARGPWLAIGLGLAVVVVAGLVVLHRRSRPKR